MIRIGTSTRHGDFSEAVVRNMDSPDVREPAADGDQDQGLLTRPARKSGGQGRDRTGGPEQVRALAWLVVPR
jgi:hypothetical protein